MLFVALSVLAGFLSYKTTEFYSKTTDPDLGAATVLSAPQGGTGQSTYTTGTILYGSAPNTLLKLTAGATGTVLTMSNGVPSWASAAGGGSYSGSSFVASTTISLDLGIVALSNCNDTNITVTGTALGDYVITSLPAQPTGVSASAYPSADVVTIRRCNSRSGNSADPAAQSYGVEVRRP